MSIIDKFRDSFNFIKDRFRDTNFGKLLSVLSEKNLSLFDTFQETASDYIFDYLFYEIINNKELMSRDLKENKVKKCKVIISKCILTGVRKHNEFVAGSGLMDMIPLLVIKDDIAEVLKKHTNSICKDINFKKIENVNDLICQFRDFFKKQFDEATDDIKDIKTLLSELCELHEDNERKKLFEEDIEIVSNVLYNFLTYKPTIGKRCNDDNNNDDNNSSKRPKK